MRSYDGLAKDEMSFGERSSQIEVEQVGKDERSGKWSMLLLLFWGA